MEEEQPRDRAQDLQQQRHSLGKFTGEFKRRLNNVHCHREFKLQETQKKKTGNGKLKSRDPAEEKESPDDDSTVVPDHREIVRSGSLLNVGLKKQSLSGEVKVFCGDVPNLSRMMDGNKKASKLQHCEKELGLSLNGEVTFGFGHMTNGYSSRSSADNEGSGSENGYSTPKRRKPRRSSVKGYEVKEKTAPRGIKTDPDASAQESAGKITNFGPNCTRTCLKNEAQPRTNVQDDETQDRSSGPASKKTDDRAGKSKLSSSATSKEDSWTLFKPPPVFPVDNSSAKIVPKISYASKVKENLNKAAELALTPAPQVPVSVVKPVTSASFANGPLPFEDNGCLLGGAAFPSASSDSLSAFSNPADVENVASDPDDRRSNPTRTPSNKQPGADAVVARPNRKALGDIFQNRWGLSFINEPNAGPEATASSRTAVSLDVAGVTFQGQGHIMGPVPSSVVSLPAPREVERRTSAGTLKINKNCPRDRPEQEELVRGSEGSFKDPDSTTPLLNCVTGQSKGQTRVKGQDGGEEWALFNLPAAVLYHTKEFEYLIAVHKQDPKRVVCYKEAMDRSDH